MKHSILSAVLLSCTLAANSQVMNNSNTDTSLAPLENVTLLSDWDKVFPLSDKVEHHKITFVNRYGIHGSFI